MSDFIDLLVARSRAAEIVIDDELDRGLLQLDGMMSGLADALRVEYRGPAVGLGGGRQVYRMVVRAHRWNADAATWSLKVCTALPHARLRADWAVQGTSRERKRRIVRVLPEFFVGYARAVREAGKADTNAGRRVLALEHRFAAG